MAQNINFSGSDQIQNPQYLDVHPPSQEISKEESLENSSNEIDASSSNQEQEIPPQDSDIHKLIREECCVEVSEEQKQSMEDMMLELVKICQQKEFLCIHDNVENLIESALNSKLLLINFQRLEKEQQEVKNVVEEPAERGNHIERSLQNFRVIHKSSISFKNTSQISSIHAVATILSTKEPEYSSSMGYEHSNTTLETETYEIIKSGVEELVPNLSKNEVTLEDKRECDMLVCKDSSTSNVCDNHSEIFSNSKIDDDISVYDDEFEDIEYVKASLSNHKIVTVEEENGVEEENVVHQEEEEVDLEDISQIQDVVLCEKLLSITRLISNIESLNDNSTLDYVLNSFESDNSILDNSSPEFETFCDHTEETRSGNTTQLMTLFPKEADLFLASDNSIPSGIENSADDPEGDIRFLEELLINDSILSHESSDSNFEDNLSVSLPPSEPPDEEFDFEIDFGDEILVVRNTIVEFECIDARVKFDDENDDYSYFMFVMVFSFLSAESEDTIFDPGIFA
nr:hypothetical protein [Tanacetum cinerariifolium]